jgi:integrase
MSSSLPIVLPAQVRNASLSLRSLLCNSIISGHTKRAYLKAFDDFFLLSELIDRPVSRALLMEYRATMIEQDLGSSTINLRLSGIRKLIREARDSGLLDPTQAERITSVAGVPVRGMRLGNWLTESQTRELLAVPDRTRLKGKRDFAILCVLACCALRRSETAALDMKRLQLREGRWVIADLVGKGGRVRTVPLPISAKDAIDSWTGAAGITSGPVFRRLSKGGRVLAGRLSGWAIWDVVKTSAQAIGVENFGAHDLRRTCARLCRQKGGELEQIQFLLGHESVQTTEIYLGSRQQIAVAVNDGLAF